MSEKKKTFLESRIQQFCESSAELLTGIQAKYNGAGNSKSKRKRSKKKKEIIDIPDTNLDINSDEPYEGLL